MLAPLSVYGEFSNRPKTTFQVGLSYVPDVLSLQPYDDLSAIIEWRRYKPKVAPMLDVLWKNAFPRGRFGGTYLKFSHIAAADKTKNTVYLGVMAGNKQMKLTGFPKKSLEFMFGAGISPLVLRPAARPEKNTWFDVRLGICIGLHYHNRIISSN